MKESDEILRISVSCRSYNLVYLEGFPSGILKLGNAQYLCIGVLAKLSEAFQKS